MAKYRGVLDKYSKQKKVLLKKAKAKEAREKKMEAALKQLETKLDKTNAEMKIELGKLEALMEEESEQDRREELECLVCCEEMAPPRTIFQCSQGHPVCSSCRPRLVHCPSCREAFMGRARGMEQLVLAILDREAE